MSDEERWAPSVFMSDYDLPEPETVASQPLPRGTEGGMVETIKRAVVSAVRDALGGTTLSDPDQKIHVDLEYPSEPLHYPGVWVQFSSTSIKRAGIDQEAWVEVEGEWCPVQEWEVQGRISLLVVALKNKDRDRLADSLITMLAFSRPPNVVLTKPGQDTNQFRALKTALESNEYVSMTLNTDVLYPSGQSVEIGAPWQPDALVYTDGYAFDILGQFNIMHRHDGVYTLRRVDVAPEPTAIDSDRTSLNQWHHGQPWPTM